MKAQSIERVRIALDAIREGRMVILVDDEDRENEGDIVMAAEHVTPEAINFMATHARGLICLSLTEERVAELELAMMVDDNRSSRRTAFTVSIEAREGVTTGISAHDRAHTIRVAVAKQTRPQDLVSPGHVFPLRAKRGGVLQRTGHTEGSIDLARLAGAYAAGIVCEIMKEDGTMARYPDLLGFATKHSLPLLSIADLVEYRLQTERLVRRERSGTVTLGTGVTWNAHVYGANVDSRKLLALTLGEVGETPTLVRVHTGSVLGDVFGVHAGLRMIISEAVERIEQEGRGVILFIPGSLDLDRDLAFHSGDVVPAVRTEQGEVLREFGLGAQVLTDLGLRRIRILTNRPRRIAGLDGYGLEVVEQLTLREEDDSDRPRTTH